MYLSPSVVPYGEPNVTVSGEKLAVADKFTYLGSTLSKIVIINEEGNYRITCTSGSFWQIHASVCQIANQTQSVPCIHLAFLTKCLWDFRQPKANMQSSQILSTWDAWGSPKKSEHGKQICNAQEIPPKMHRACVLYVWWVHTKEATLVSWH